VRTLSTEGALASAADKVCAAIRRHAATCEQRPDDVGAVVREGEALSQAVLDYEAVLGAESGWSNPIRHLGPLPVFRAQPGRVPGRSGAVRVGIEAHYRLQVGDEDAVLAFVSGRFGDEVSDLGEAVEKLFKSESWDPQRYPPGLLDVEDIEVGVTIDHE